MEQEVVEFCKSYLVVNKEAFLDSRLEVVINDARSDIVLISIVGLSIIMYFLTTN